LPNAIMASCGDEVFTVIFFSRKLGLHQDFRGELSVYLGFAG
jgi:hypothetical protein